MRPHLINGELSVTVVSGRELTPETLSSWSRMVAENPDLASPFFAPQYTMAVASALPEVYVGIAERHGEPVALLPFERSRFGLGRRLRLCDYQGLIACPGLQIDITAFIRACGLRAWDFDHLLASQRQFAPFHSALTQSPVIDLSNGFEDYAAERRAAGTEQIKKAANLTRRIEREVGALRFQPNVEDKTVLRQLLGWRYGKYQDTRHKFDLVATILDNLMESHKPECHGTLSALYAGDQIAAAHFGLRSQRSWHYWFPAYNPRFERYSPGIILLLNIARFASEIGITNVDLGKGVQDYKSRLMNRSILLARGSVEASACVSLARKAAREIKCWLRSSRMLCRPARGLALILRKLVGQD